MAKISGKGETRIFYVVKQERNKYRPEEIYVLRVGRNRPMLDVRESVACEEKCAGEEPRFVKRTLDKLKRKARENGIPFVLNLDIR